MVHCSLVNGVNSVSSELRKVLIHSFVFKTETEMQEMDAVFQKIDANFKICKNKNCGEKISRELIQKKVQSNLCTTTTLRTQK